MSAVLLTPAEDISMWLNGCSRHNISMDKVKEVRNGGFFCIATYTGHDLTLVFLDLLRDRYSAPSLQMTVKIPILELNIS